MARTHTKVLLIVGLALAAVSGCKHANPSAYMIEQFKPRTAKVEPRTEPQTSSERNTASLRRAEIPLYDLTDAYGLEVSIDLVTGRRVCRDDVNELTVTPSAEFLVLNGEEFALNRRIRWQDGVLLVPGKARSILAEHLRILPVPEVATDPDRFDGSELDIQPGWLDKRSTKQASAPRQRPNQQSVDMPRAWRVKGARRWRYIVIHHSATTVGGAKSFHREHAKKWKNGLGYHFVIGNGSSTGDGQIEVGTRWKRQGQGIDGAHAGNKKYNQFGIGVCLVGEFNKGRPTARQLVALRQLCRTLMKEYGIPKSHVLPHQAVRKGHTDCPGKEFPFRQFVRGL